MGNTPNWNIYYAENGAPADARTESATQAGTVETALDSVGGDIVSVNNFGIRYFANASARDLALTSPSVGWLTQLDSELFMRRWDGAAWRPYGSGLYPIKPSSVSGTGVSVDTSGVVSFTGATAVGIDGVFSNDFQDYQVEFEMTAASVDANPAVRLRVSGVDDSANYNNHYLFGFGSTASASAGGDVDRILICTTAGRQITSRVSVKGPALSRPTVIRSEFGGFDNAADGFEGVISSRHTPASGFDGLGFVPSSGNFTGRIRIYGIL